MRHLVLFGCLLIGLALVNAVTSPPILPSMSISSFNVQQIESNTVEEYFRLDVSEDAVTWKTVGHFNQPPIQGATTPVFRARLEVNSTKLFCRRVPETQAEFDAGQTDGTFGTGIIVFKK